MKVTPLRIMGGYAAFYFDIRRIDGGCFALGATRMEAIRSCMAKIENPTVRLLVQCRCH